MTHIKSLLCIHTHPHSCYPLSPPTLAQFYVFVLHGWIAPVVITAITEGTRELPRKHHPSPSCLEAAEMGEGGEGKIQHACWCWWYKWISSRVQTVWLYFYGQRVGNKYSFPVNRIDFGKVCQEGEEKKKKNLNNYKFSKILKLKINIGSLTILSIC